CGASCGWQGLDERGGWRDQACDGRCVRVLSLPGWRVAARLIEHPWLGPWMAPGGHVENDECQAQAAVRKVEEEAQRYYVTAVQLAEAAGSDTLAAVALAALARQLFDLMEPEDGLEAVALAQHGTRHTARLGRGRCYTPGRRGAMPIRAAPMPRTRRSAWPRRPTRSASPRPSRDGQTAWTLPS
ncbi:MAG: NUDIX domain-containing protein, partial [Pseudonocardiaceae bacterium]